MVANERWIVAKHEQKIARPHNHIELHECGNGRMANHRVGYNFVLLVAEELLLQPIDEVTTRFCAEHINEHHHNPQAKGSRKYKVFGFGYNLSVYYFRLCAMAMSVILEEEFDPACPEKHGTDKTKKRLFGVALDENAPYYQYKAKQTNKESDNVNGRR